MDKSLVRSLIGATVCGAFLVWMFSEPAPSAAKVTELSRVARDRDNALVVSIQGPIGAPAVKAFAAAEQRQHDLVRVYVYGKGVTPGAGDAEALYERRRDGSFDRRY